MTETLTKQTESTLLTPAESSVLHSAVRAVDEHWVTSPTLRSTGAVDLSAGGDPMETLIDQWVQMAVRHARVRRMDDEWVADVAGLDGAWSEGKSKRRAEAGLARVLNSWVRLKLADGDRDIPLMEGLRLVVDV